MKNKKANNKFRFYIGHTLTISSIFLMGVLFPVQLIIPLPLYIWIILVAIFLIGIYQNVKYTENKELNK